MQGPYIASRWDANYGEDLQRFALNLLCLDCLSLLFRK